MNNQMKEVKREEFRKYLEHAGVMDALTNTLITLYEESDKPADPLDYIRKKLCVKNEDSEVLKKELENLRCENEELKKRLNKYEPSNPNQ